MEVKNDWNSLYDYVKEILNYDKNQKLPSFLILRLRGLKKGQFVANKNNTAISDYPYEVIRLTFALKKDSIQYAIRTKDFKDEKHKINYIMTIVESSLNDVYKSYMNMKNQQKKNEQKVEDISSDTTNRYVQKTKTNLDDKLKDLWQN